MATPIPENRARFSVAQLLSLLSPSLSPAARSLDPSGCVVGVCTDTRANLAGKLFVALPGERFDGHRFLGEAAAAGAALAVVEQDVPEAPPSLPLLRVNSSLQALATLANAHRIAWGKPVVAVAGSAGKTTTRSLTASLLSQLKPGRVHTPAGNLNNRIGVPMVLFGLAAEHDYAVIEIGTNQPGEVAALARSAAPELGVLTLIDLEHSEGLGDLEAIEREEGALFTWTTQTTIGNGDDVRVVRQVAHHRQRLESRLYGYAAHNDYRVLSAVLCEARPANPGSGVASRPGLCMRVHARRPAGPELTFYTPFIGEPGVLSSMGALACVETLLGISVSEQDIEAALYRPGARQTGRLQPHQLSDGTLVIDDSYNANPASVLAGLAIAAELARLRKTQLHAVLGQMGELGAFSQVEHRRVGAALANLDLASLTAVGGDARLMLSVSQKNAEFVAGAELAAGVVRRHLRPGDVVFVKASRGVAAERVVQGLLEDIPPNKEASGQP